MQRPNLILLNVDCWRADHFGTLTPHLAGLAGESTLFPRAIAPGGWTRISMTALMSSAYASMHGGHEIALQTPARRVIAECLLENGYWTGGFTANPSCGNCAGFHRGFATFRDALRTPDLPPGAPADWKKEWPRLLEMGVSPRDIETFVDARELTDLGLQWLGNRTTGEPYFLWLHYLDPHWPCHMRRERPSPDELRILWHDVDVFRNRVIPSRGRYDPGPEARQRWARRYRESLTRADLEIGRLLTELRKRPDWDRTIIAVCGDHGEELFERGTWHHSWNQLHREGIEVPLILRIPGNPPQTVLEPSGLLDLVPTLLDYAGIAPPPSMMGRSLRPLIGGATCESRPIFTEMMGHGGSAAYRLAIRDGDWKYIYDFEDPHNSKLFCVADDPEETVNRRSEAPEIFRRLEQLRLAHVTLGLTSLMRRAPASALNPTLPGQASSEREIDYPAGHSAGGDDLLRGQLEALGYL